MATTEDAATISLQEAVVPTYDPSNPSPTLDTPASGYDQLIITNTQNSATVPPRGY